MSYADIEIKIIQWAEARKIIPNSNPESQLLKAVSEIGELEFQQEHGWAVNYEAVDNSEDETEEEEVPPFALGTHEPL